jgi:hypothetical protein
VRGAAWRSPIEHAVLASRRYREVSLADGGSGAVLLVLLAMKPCEGCCGMSTCMLRGPLARGREASV